MNNNSKCYLIGKNSNKNLKSMKIESMDEMDRNRKRVKIWLVIWTVLIIVIEIVGHNLEM